jgi:hypothetical protein
MQDYVLRVGEALVIEGYLHLTILAVQEDKAVLGISEEANGERGPEACPWRPRLAAVTAPAPSDN